MASRFEVATKIVLRDTKTGDTVDISNKTYHLVDERMDQSVVDTFVKDIKAGQDIDERDGYFEDFSKVMQYVSLLAILIKEYKLPQYIEPMLNNDFDLVDDILDKFKKPPKFLN